MNSLNKMLGAISGDVLGSVYEFDPIKSKDFELLGADCFFTDDTVMTIAVADSLMNGRDYVETLQMWAQKYPRAGYGGWFNKWIYEDFPEPYNSFGNGSAMRSSSVGWLFDDEDAVLKEAEKSAEITHNHPEGIKGVQAVALGVLMGRKGCLKLPLNRMCGGGRGIRTPEDLAALTDFKSVGFNHSPIPPHLIIVYNIQ